MSTFRARRHGLGDHHSVHIQHCRDVEVTALRDILADREEEIRHWRAKYNETKVALLLLQITTTSDQRERAANLAESYHSGLERLTGDEPHGLRDDAA